MKNDYSSTVQNSYQKEIFVRSEMKFSDPKKSIFGLIIFNKSCRKGKNDKYLPDINLSVFSCGLTILCILLYNTNIL